MASETPSSGTGRQDPLKPPRPLCIVVVDDDRDTVWTMMMVLRHEGHEVYGAHSAQQALDAVLKHDPDAVLLDIALPSVSGHEIARKIRARHGTARPVLIGISGQYKQGSDKILAEINGFDHYLTKPYEPSAVLRLLEPLRSGDVRG
jgi:two-component system, chemotaxis family, CheB/CheR fusion protein